jgi:hypothetical protein
MNEKALDLFGEMLISQVRDRTIREWDKIIAGQMKGEKAQSYAEIFKELTAEQQECIKSVISQIIDTTLHFTLWAFEQSNNLDISVAVDSESVQRLKEISDGLTGELYTEDGWIMRFSKERYEEL